MTIWITTRLLVHLIAISLLFFSTGACNYYRGGGDGLGGGGLRSVQEHLEPRVES